MTTKYDQYEEKSYKIKNGIDYSIMREMTKEN